MGKTEKLEVKEALAIDGTDFVLTGAIVMRKGHFPECSQVS